MERWRACLMTVVVWLGCAGCDTKPIVLLGQAPRVVVDAAVRAEDARVDDHPGEDVECEELDPVCGSDGSTYRNACQALDHGTTVAKRGPC